MQTLLLPLGKICQRSKWIADHKSYFKRFFRVGQRFTNDTLHDVFDAPPEKNYWGALVATLKEDGIIAEVGRVTSKRSEANGRKITQWEVVQ